MSDRADPPAVVLPPRAAADEDRFVADMAEADPVLCYDAVSLAMEARRPRLAARLVQLLDEGDQGADPLVARARQAATLWLVGPATSAGWSALEDAWEALRKDRMWRIRERMRRSQDHGRTDRLGRLDGRRGRRRR